MSIKQQPTWEDVSREYSFDKLKGEERVDVAVIGGGLAGILTAYLLTKEGKSAAVLEKNTVGSVATRYTTAFLTQDTDTDLTDLIKMYGIKNAKLVWESHAEAIDLVEDIVWAEKIDCEFTRCPAYVYAVDENGFEDLEAEVKAAKRLGFKSSINMENFVFRNYGVMEIKNQAKFHPLKFLYQLADRAAGFGARIFEKTEIVQIERPGGKGEWKITSSSGGVLFAEKVVVATYMPFNNPKPTHFKKGMYSSYVYEAKVPKGLLKEAIYWDDDNPYNYFRIDPLKKDGKFDRMIIGGQDHREEIKMKPDKNFKALDDYMHEVFPGVKYQITRKWDGPILEPSDGLALIGQVFPQQYVATAFSGNGMTYSGIAGMLLTDLIMKRENPWAKLYDPKRVPSLYQLMKKGKDYSGEFFGGAGKNFLKKVKKKP